MTPTIIKFLPLTPRQLLHKAVRLADVSHVTVRVIVLSSSDFRTQLVVVAVGVVDVSVAVVLVIVLAVAVVVVCVAVVDVSVAVVLVTVAVVDVSVAVVDVSGGSDEVDSPQSAWS